MEDKARMQRNEAQENELREKIGLEDDRKKRRENVAGCETRESDQHATCEKVETKQSSY